MRPEVRLSKLEAILDIESMDLSWLTDDELKMELLDCSRSIAADPAAPAELREQMTQQVAELQS